VTTVRRIATDLRPALLDDFGLAAAMEWQLQEFEKRSGLTCRFTTNADGETLPLAPEAVTALFRVFQETLTNVARHAQATAVEARLELSDAQLELEVRDNGRGITRAEATGRRSLGLLGMRERVALLNGELHLDGAPGQGTRVTVRLPLPPNH
jgi:signal transduction histidine kinase